MVYSIQTCALVGLDPHPVLCEVDLAKQLPAFTLVGLPSSMTQESRERIRAAVVNAGFDWPSKKITVNMLPASLPKWGSHYELAMALGVLAAEAELPSGFRTFALGELSLSGEIRPCGWLAAIAGWIKNVAEQVRAETGEPLLLVAHESDIAQLSAVWPEAGNACELAGVGALMDAFRAIAEASQRLGKGKKTRHRLVNTPLPAASASFATLAKVKHEPLGTLAALVAIAGRHHCLFAGPHGMGKSMLIRAICEATAPLSEPERVERETVLMTFGDQAMAGSRPVASLQTSISRAALEGALLNTGQVLPGELTRAHLGLLVADELLEFRRDVIEALRQPLDEGIVRLQRAKLRTVLPAKFQFLASTNLCPCGLWGQTRIICRCPKPRRILYQQKLSGPILDRFDLIVTVGQRTESDRTVEIPGDLIKTVATLIDPAGWEERLGQARALTVTAAAQPPADPAELWSQVPSSKLSDRGKLKLARVSKTLAALLGEERQGKHLRLAQLIRQNLHGVLKEPLPTDKISVKTAI